MVAGFLTADGAADFGWTGYTPLSDITRSPGPGADLWLVAVVLTGLSGVLTGGEHRRHRRSRCGRRA